MLVVAATKNSGKLRELRAIFAPFDWQVESDPQYLEPEEGEDSYQTNAALKARALHAQLRARGRRATVLGDDSGIEVAALRNGPGVTSARYGGTDIDWGVRRALLLSELALSPETDRTARFVCALHLVAEDGRELAVTRDVHGRIAESERGSGGFSYDALFEFPPGGPTFAERTEEEKNALSHRAKAAAALHEAWTAAHR